MQELRRVADVPTGFKGETDQEAWVNDLYQVFVRRLTMGELELVHLSIKRHDREPVTDWRHKQQIKNQLAGEEWEGAEIYPAMSRLVDSSNQYHIWCVPMRFPFGFDGRFLRDSADMKGAVQRPIDPELGWAVTSDEETRQRFEEAGLLEGPLKDRVNV